MSRYDAVLFDVGDTLIRLCGSGETLLHRAAAALGADPLDPDEAAQVWRRVLDRSGTADELAKGRDLSNDRHHEVWTALYRSAGCERLAAGLSERLYEFTVDAGSWEAFADAVPTLAALRKRGLRVGVVSDTGFDLRPALDRLGLAPFLDSVVMSFEYGICKPAPKMFLTACDQLQVSPDRTLMVGDNPLTDSGAVATGMHVFLLPPPARTGPRGLGQVLSLVSSGTVAACPTRSSPIPASPPPTTPSTPTARTWPRTSRSPTS